MRRAVIAFAGALAAGLAVALVLGLTQGSSLVYALGVTAATPAAELRSGHRTCQAPIRVPDGAAFDRVAFTLGTYFRPGPEVLVEVIDDRSRRVLGSGTLRAGYPDIARAGEHVVRVGEVRTSAPLRLCLTNEGRRRVAVFGQAGVASPLTSATLEGDPIATDMALTLRAEETSLIGLLPTMIERASRFRAGWVSPLVYLALGIALLIGAPLLLARGLRSAAAADEGPGTASR